MITIIVTPVMEIIEQMKSIVETNQSLTEENRKFGDTLDEKDEAIKNQRETIDRQKTWQTNYIKSKKEEIKNLTKENQKLDTKLIQISSQVGIHDKRLSQEVNSLTNKLLNRDKQIEELKEQIDQTKINSLVAKDNEIALLKVRIQKMDGAMDEIIKSVNKIGYVKHKLVIGRYNNDKPKYKTCFLPEYIVQHLKECPQKARLRPAV
tara:strand:+ start:723 stop:1343 length:621 start_codon:yes stop_codon:yes gene_type:complete